MAVEKPMGHVTVHPFSYYIQSISRLVNHIDQLSAIRSNIKHSDFINLSLSVVPSPHTNINLEWLHIMSMHKGYINVLPINTEMRNEHLLC